ncbi:hypothetical protein [Streptomyces alfalfae]|uniref:Uncharacterized protein n=1 Tax=Streptomyces alfalfae TaxID=1642299 RepID=A0A7T4PGH6_9ACTN|nr:hypothetical protein [Streptomyces alfalfae]QQC89831.1 hypothetical protein I8755_16485 [Streptomyces alfalfae]
MGIKRATQAFTAYIDGMPRVVHAGDLVPDTDPVLQGRTQLFEDVEEHVAHRHPSPQTESATAAPGETRNLTPPAARGPGTADTTPAPSRRGRRTTK